MKNFVAVYVAAYERYRGQIVNLDDIIQSTVSANLATSSGHMGEAAISRSTRKDRSRDPLYNQLKMYGELFRSLGWLRSTDESALNYTFTLLGEQVVAAGWHWRNLLGESALGIASPTHVLNKLSQHNIRPFASILRTMLACNDGLSRDEIIVGPLSATSDRSQADMETLSQKIIELRAYPEAIKAELGNLEDEHGVQTNTLRNYTRWPLALMRDLQWTEKDREAYQSGSKTFELHRLTPLGKERAQSLGNFVDLRVDQVDNLPFEQKRALSRHAHFAMMERAGFDISSVVDRLHKEEDAFRGALQKLGVAPGKLLLFSPFQSVTNADLDTIFPAQPVTQVSPSNKVVLDGVGIGRGSRDHLFVTPNFVPRDAKVENTELNELKLELVSIRKQHQSLDIAVRAFVESRIDDTQTEFYPLVTYLIQLLGFRSDYSRAGVNYQRWDACVWLHDQAVPIEIKSPTEELFLSTKAVRQAIENKVILLSRGGFDTTPELTSLIVGYKIPNERGDLSALIDDIHIAYNLKIGVLDLRTLTFLAMRAVTQSMSIDERMLSHLKGFLDV